MFYKKSVSNLPVGAHTHNTTEIYLTLTDLPDVLLNDTVSRVSSGSLIIIPPFCIHQLYHEQGIEYERYVMEINTEWLEHVLTDNNTNTDYLKCADKPVIITLENEQIELIISKMNQFISVQEANNIRTLTYFFEILEVIDLLARSNEKENVNEPIITEAQKKVNEIIAYINENIMIGIKVEEIAEHFYLNKDYISRLFSEHTHTTIGKYIAFQRISKAQELLRAGKTVNEVQEMMGYSSYAHFFKTFQKMTGVSPSRYRRG